MILRYASAVIGQDTLDRIRRETDLVALIGESLKLQRRGRSFVGLCPFHKEKSPSFHVNAERGFYHCFGCHASGDAFKFVQEIEGLDFQEAVRRLADRAGIVIDWQISDAELARQREVRRRADELYEVVNLAAAYFERMLREHPLSAYARAELERRKLVPSSPTDPVADALQAFRVGYAPFGWDGLAQSLKNSGASLVAAEKVGLVAARKNAVGYYDRFRHRLMFAVLDLQGRPIAFSGRALEEPPAAELRELSLAPSPPGAEKPAKYYNSPESAIYKKREAVFGLYQARNAIRTQESAVIVEGNFDVLSLHAFGVKNAVAPLGTAFTLEQAQQLRRFTNDVVLLFDGDEAGKRAVQGAREVCQKAALGAKVATLPTGSDPDELIRKQGREALDLILNRARGLLEYLIDGVLDETFSESDARTRAARVKKVIELLGEETDPTVRALAERHADRIAQRLNITDEPTFRALVNEVRRALDRDAAGVSAPKKELVAPPVRARSPDRRDSIGLEILGVFLDFPQLFEDPEASSAGELLEGDTAIAFAALRQLSKAGAISNPEQVLAKLPPSIHQFARARLVAPRHSRTEDAQSELSGNIRQLKALVLRRDKRNVVEELERARRTGDFEQEQELLKQLFSRARQHRAVVSE
ncbi:MAG TPA: DNA primase [Polyangiaceae bacterium]|nr:DNA primase [Polyangiaceae bacterium]